MNAKTGGRNAVPGREREPVAAVLFRLVIVYIGWFGCSQSIRSGLFLIGTRRGIFKKK